MHELNEIKSIKGCCFEQIHYKSFIPLVSKVNNALGDLKVFK